MGWSQTLRPNWSRKARLTKLGLATKTWPSRGKWRRRSTKKRRKKGERAKMGRSLSLMRRCLLRIAIRPSTSLKKDMKRKGRKERTRTWGRRVLTLCPGFSDKIDLLDFSCPSSRLKVQWKWGSTVTTAKFFNEMPSIRFFPPDSSFLLINLHSFLFFISDLIYFNLYKH